MIYQMNFKIEKKRIVILDKDLEGVDMEEWKRIMRHVLGRHYRTIKNYEGSGWTFPSHALEIFESMISKLMPPQVAIESHFKYKYDIDASLYRLRDQWLQDLQV
jgi:hypothetical protein